MNPLAPSPAGAPAPSLAVLEAIYGRRSVRSYAPRAVAPSEVEELLDAAVHAPTALHREPLAFAVVQDRALLARLNGDCKREFDRRRHPFVLPDDAFHGAGTLIVIYGVAAEPYFAADGWLAAENLMLAAHALGLGTCLIGMAVPTLNERRWKEELGAGPELEAVAALVAGTPAEPTPPPGRNPPRVLCWRRGLA